MSSREFHKLMQSGARGGEYPHKEVIVFVRFRLQIGQQCLVFLLRWHVLHRQRSLMLAPFDGYGLLGKFGKLLESRDAEINGIRLLALVFHRLEITFHVLCIEVICILIEELHARDVACLRAVREIELLGEPVGKSIELVPVAL